MSFGRDVQAFSLKTGNATDQFRRAVCVELFGSVIQDTPVDTGRARGNWQTTVGIGAQTMIQRTDPSGAQAMAEAMSNLGSLGDTVFLTNNLPYIERLEYGYSLQAPEGMVRKNFARVQSIVRQKAQAHKV